MGAKVEQGDAMKWLQQQSINVTIDLTIFSPPYALKGCRYGDNREKWQTLDWVKWMTGVVYWSCMATDGWVIVVANGAVRNGEYEPACEGLIWTLSAECPEVVIERPCIWHKNAATNRGDKWFTNAWEPVMAFYHRQLDRPDFDWRAVSHKAKYTTGGRYRQRAANGARRLGNEYPKGELARPRDVIYATVGGGHMGSKLAHENEAPYPEELIRPFIKACCPAGGVVADPFSGSGTTASVAIQEGRSFIGCDARQDQVELTLRRIAETEERMKAKV